ncbi:hypothetical protein EsH8_II_000759 [Colletotrichum jinshuiense]
MSRTVMKWTPEVDQQILVAMVKAINPTGDQYSAIIDELHACGHSFTASALKCAFPSFRLLPLFTSASAGSFLLHAVFHKTICLPLLSPKPPSRFIITHVFSRLFYSLYHSSRLSSLILHLITLISITMAPVTLWNDKARSDLLVALLLVVKPSKEEWDQALVTVRAKGYSYNATAAMQHIQKLQRKEQAAAENGEESASASNTPANKTSGKKAVGKKTPTPRKRKAAVKKGTANANDAEDGEEQATPPPKKPCTPSRPNMKDETDHFLDLQGAGDVFVPNNNGEI